MKRTGIILVLLSGLLAGCSTAHEERMDYATASAKPGYGYITMDFRKGKEVAYGRNYVEGKTSYTIMYTKGKYAVFLKVTDVPFDQKIFNAYIPYYKDYTFRDMYRMVYLPEVKNSGNGPQSHFVTIYSVQAISEAWCPETERQNGETFNYDDGCPNDWRDKHGANGVKDTLGDVYITPHFNTGTQMTFTNRPSPVRARVGA